MQNNLQSVKQTYRYLFKLPVSVPLIVLFIIIMIMDKIKLAMLLKTNGAIWILSALGIVLVSEFIFKKFVYYYCTNGKFSDIQLNKANSQAKWITYLSVVLLIIGMVYVRYLIKMPI